MKLVVGLGNIGSKYASTRHNIGFMVADALVEGEWHDDQSRQAFVRRQNTAGQEIILAKPTTMMNDSGTAVGKLAQHYKILPEDIWIIYDELDLPLGRIKLATGTSDNGHNGLISISQRLGHNRFWRFKIGVDNRVHREIPGLEYVLQPFLESEQPLLHLSVKQASKAVLAALSDGLPAAMQAYNKATAAAAE